ncbi:AAA family ATPase [Luteococcus sanguinis]
MPIPPSPGHRLSPFESNLVELVRARHSVLLVETQESERVIDAVKRLTASDEFPRRRAVRLYTLTKGLHLPDEPGGRRLTPEDALAQAARVPEPTIFVFHDLHHQLGATGRPPEPVLVRTILDTAVQFKTGPVPHTLIIVAPSLELPAELEKITTVVDLPYPDTAEIEAALDTIISANREAITVRLSQDERERLVQAAQGLTLWEADNAFARAIVTDRVLDSGDIELILEEKRQTIRKSGLLEFIPPRASLADVGGLDNLKRWLVKRDGAWLPEAELWSLPAPKGLLVTGVPGCGKSLTAAAVSSQWGLPLLRLDVGRVFAGLVGSSEQNMRQALKLAEAVAPSILWIDEIEKGFGSGSAGDSGTSQRVFGSFLTWMQEKKKPVFVMATANKIDALPPEFLRKGRFDEIFFVDLPTQHEREEIWRLHLTRRLTEGPRAAGGMELTPQLQSRLAEESESFSGAEIAQAVISACFEAFSERRPLEVGDLLRAIETTIPLAVTQSEQVNRIREWAGKRAVAATSADARDRYSSSAPADPEDVASWRGGRSIDF